MVKKIDKIGEDINAWFKEFFAFENEDEKIDLMASIIHINIMNQVITLMAKRGLTKRKLAQDMGIGLRKFNNIMSADTTMDLKIISRFEKALDVKFDIKIKEKKDVNR